MREEYTCKVVSKTMLTPDTAYITIACPAIADLAVPGQFVNVSCSKFLKRPFGIADVDKDNGTFSIGVKIVGAGTSELSEITDGAVINVLGPLGNGFDLSLSDNYVLVSGGTGVFPINFTYNTLVKMGKKVSMVQGFRDKSQMCLTSDDYVVTTDAGDYGIKGTCIKGLDTLSISHDSVVCCVGPIPMMKAVGEWAEGKGLKCYISMEQRMACGIGICLVCVCKKKAEAEGVPFEHVRCCKDGPVFDFKEVIL